MSWSSRNVQLGATALLVPGVALYSIELFASVSRKNIQGSHLHSLDLGELFFRRIANYGSVKRFSTL